MEHQKTGPRPSICPGEEDWAEKIMGFVRGVCQTEKGGVVLFEVGGGGWECPKTYTVFGG